MADAAQENFWATDRIKHEGGVGFAVEYFQEGTDQGCFTRADFPCEHYKAFSALDPVYELGQAFPVACAQVEEIRIRRDAERFPEKAEMFLINRIHKRLK